MNEPCCKMRVKVIIIMGPLMPEERCGVPDSIITDFMRFDLTGPPGPDGRPKPVLGIRFCPWCGKPITYDSPTRITGFGRTGPPDEESGEEWKQS